MTEEYKQVEVTYKFHLPDNENELKTHQLAQDLFSAVFEIAQECRTVLKHGPRSGEGVEEFAEKIQELCSESKFYEIV